MNLSSEKHFWISKISAGRCQKFISKCSMKNNKTLDKISCIIKEPKIRIFFFFDKIKQRNRWQWCWWHRYVGDFMMVTGLRCWLQNHYVGDFPNVLNRSPTTKTCHQHLWSPTSVTNIDVTGFSDNFDDSRIT